MDLSTGESDAGPNTAPPPLLASAPRRAAGRARVRSSDRPPERGELTPGWRIVTGVVWALAFVALVAVWKTSRELGLSTWWLGPLGDPQPWFVTLVPFVPPTAMVLLTLNNAPFVPWAGLGAAGVVAVVGAVDLDRVARLGVVELAIAGAGALVAVTGFAGRYRAGRG